MILSGVPLNSITVSPILKYVSILNSATMMFGIQEIEFKLHFIYGILPSRGGISNLSNCSSVSGHSNSDSFSSAMALISPTSFLRFFAGGGDLAVFAGMFFNQNKTYLSKKENAKRPNTSLTSNFHGLAMVELELCNRKQNTIKIKLKPHCT